MTLMAGNLRNKVSCQLILLLSLKNNQMTNILKSSFLAGIFIGTGLLANAVPDPAVLGGTISQAPALWPRVTPEVYENFTFQINNNGTGTSNALVKVIISLSAL